MVLHYYNKNNRLSNFKIALNIPIIVKNIQTLEIWLTFCLFSKQLTHVQAGVHLMRFLYFLMLTMEFQMEQVVMIQHLVA